ncbi:MAG: response regulator transcription factor [Gaiellaceae bacterium]
MGVEKPTALVVDDDASLRALCRINLELEGFAVREAGCLAAATEAIEDARPQLVLLDVHLGSEESSSLLERLRAEGIPVGIVTGSADPDEWRARADAVLTKPFTPQALIDVACRLAV